MILNTFYVSTIWQFSELQIMLDCDIVIFRKGVIYFAIFVKNTNENKKYCKLKYEFYNHKHGNKNRELIKEYYF